MSNDDSIICLDEQENSNDIIAIIDCENNIEKKNFRYKPPESTFKNENELITFIKMLRNIKNESPAKWHQTIELFDLFFTEKQARFILKSCGKDELNESVVNLKSSTNKNYIFHHVVFCRVVDRHNLKKWVGAEGYYYCEEGVKPNDNYKTITSYF